MCATEAAHLNTKADLRNHRAANVLPQEKGWPVDSVDGTYLQYGPEVNGRRLAGWLRRLETAPTLF